MVYEQPAVEDEHCGLGERFTVSFVESERRINDWAIVHKLKDFNDSVSPFKNRLLLVFLFHGLGIIAKSHVLLLRHHLPTSNPKSLVNDLNY